MNRSFYYIFFAIISLMTLFSCLGDDDTEYYYSPDAELQFFSIKNDSISRQLDSLKFTIDQVKGLIYNKDSARFGLEIDDKVIVTFTTASSFNLLHIGTEDSTWLATGDSLDINDIVVLRSYAQTGAYKDYKFQLNIHQIDPDSIIWEKVTDLNFLSGSKENTTIYRDGRFITFSSLNNEIVFYTYTAFSLYTPPAVLTNLPADTKLAGLKIINNNPYVYTASGDFYRTDEEMMIWSQIPVENNYRVRGIPGGLNREGVISVILENNGILFFAIYDENTGWEIRDSDTDLRNQFPSFPLTDFTSLSYNHINQAKLSVFGGENATAWSTTDGFYWAKLSNLPANIAGGNVFVYDEKLYLINGRSVSTGSDNYNIYISSDEGINWFSAQQKQNIPGELDFIGRSSASVVVDDENNIYIIAGKRNNSAMLTDIWRGRMNKFN